MLKRAFDLLGATGGLIVLSPLLVGVAIAIKFLMPGPVFFRQLRIGRHGIPFRIFKFRTMSGAEPKAGPSLTIGADPRITPLGHFLRESKIDELPQLFNVLAGEMSLVGPRPEVPKYVDTWTAEQKEVVLSVRPGLTGPASVKFHDQTTLLAHYADPEKAYIEVILPEKLKLCMDYVRTGTVMTDVSLIVRTILTLIGLRR
jgi:lipopolysaccharide/colanic/teichoic acid biosynthesis glycosyltransferase